MYTTVFDSVMGYPWVYYLLGRNNQQLAVYHGQQVSDTKCGKTGRRVYMYPVEYLSYGVGSVMSFTTDANGVKQYKIADHLGSTRLAVSGAGTDGQYNYAPYGKREVVSATSATRKGFIDREQDLETGLGNFGVRGYDEDEGVFPSVDPKAEQYPSLNPYQYGGNNALKFVDPNGMEFDVSDLASAGYAKNIMSDLSVITGLSFYIEGGMMKYKKDAKGNPIVAGGKTSSLARNYIIRAINSKVRVIAKVGYSGSHVPPHTGRRVMEIDPLEVQSLIKGTAGGLNPLTESWGMNFMHESLHTVLGPGGGLWDDLQTTGGVVDFQNQVRRELGDDWGQRMLYSPINVQGGICYPFDKTSLDYMKSQGNTPFLQRKLPPQGMYIMLR